MRAITKGTAPVSLTRHRQTTHSDYDNFDDKDTLRDTLVAEQRGLCCYCMCRITSEWSTMKIEHWHCRTKYRDEELQYQNLLGACVGGEWQPSRLQHCDTKKRYKDLKWNPANPLHHIETRIHYSLDGEVRSNDPIFDKQLDDVLNLNLAFLKNNRKMVLDSILNWWRHEKARIRGPVPRANLERQRNNRITGNGVMAPFSPVAVWWLEQRLAGMAP